MKNFTKPHFFEWDGETPDLKGTIYCACQLPEDNPLHIEPTTKKEKILKFLTLAVKAKKKYTDEKDMKKQKEEWEREVEIVVSAIVGAVDEDDVETATQHLKEIVQEAERRAYEKGYCDARNRYKERERLIKLLKKV